MHFQWGSHGYIDPMTKEFIKRLRRNNVALGRVCSIIDVLSAESVVPIRKQSVKNLCARMAQEDIQDDMKKTMELLGKMKEEDPDLEVRFKTDDEGRIELGKIKGITSTLGMWLLLTLHTEQTCTTCQKYLLELTTTTKR